MFSALFQESRFMDACVVEKDRTGGFPLLHKWDKEKRLCFGM